MSSPSTFMTPGESFTIILSKANMAGFQKVLCHVLRFGVLQPVAKQSSLFFHCTSTMSTPREQVLPRTSTRLFVLLWSFKTLIWLQVTSMVKLGVATAVTISVLLMRLLLIVFCLRRRALHRCGVPDPFRTLGRMFVVFLSLPVLSASGRWASTVLSLHLDKLSVYAPMIKAAIMRRGFICTSLTGVTSGTTRLATTGISAS